MSGKRWWRNVVAGLLLALLWAVDGYGSDAGEYADDIEEGRWVAAGVKLGGLLKGELSELDRVIFTCDLALVERKKGDAKEGLSVLEGLPDGLKRQARPQLEKGLCLQAMKQDVAAESVLLPLTGVEENRIRLPAGLALAQMLMAREEYEQAIDACNKVLTDGRGESLTGMLEVVTETRKLLELATDAFALKVLGADYQIYRRARMAQAKGEYAEAIELYSQIKKNPVLLDAARCYMAESFYLWGEGRKGERLYKDFVAGNVFGLYRGEARLHWARFRLLEESGASSLQQARQLLEEASEWFEVVGAKSPPIDIGDVQLMVKYFPAPSQFTRPGDLGGLVRSYAGPASILNRLTARWYIPMHHVHALLLLGYTCFELEDYEAAAAALDKAVALNHAYGRAFMTDEGARSQLHAGLAARSFLVPRKAWDKASAKHARRLHLACFYTMAGQYDSALALFTETIRRDATERLRSGDLSLANYGLARCLFGQGKLEDAVKQLSPFQGDLRREELAEEATLLMANILAGSTGKGYEQARMLYAELGRRGSSVELRAQALLSLAVTACNHGENEVAVKVCAALIKHYPEAVQTPAARTLAARLAVGNGVVRAGLPPADPPEIVTEAGRVVPVNAHLILPGSKRLHDNPAALKAADLMRYQVTASPQSDCIIIRGFTVRFTPYEPQIEPAVGRQAQFIRAPVLLRETLWADPVTQPEPYTVSEGGELLFWQGKLDMLLGSKDFRGAEAHVRKLLDDPRTSGGYLPLLRADLARVYRLGGAPEKGAMLIDSLDFSVQTQRRVRLERGLIALAMGETAKAEELLTRAREANEPEIRAVATWRLAEIAHGKKEYGLAGKLAAEVVQQARDASTAEVKSFLEPARELIEASQRDEIVGLHGEGYWHYRQGRIAQSRGRHAEAVAAFEKVKENEILSEAAGLYRAMALASQNDAQGARKAFETVLATWPDGFYTGEALLEWASMEYLAANGEEGVRQARTHLDGAVDWMAHLGSKRRDLTPVAAIVKSWPTGERMARPGRPGWPGPGCIVNPLTTPWYLDYLALRIHFLRGFLAGEVGEQEAAASGYAAACEVIRSQGFSPTVVDLRLSQGLANGAYLAPAKRWRLLDRNVRQRLRLACFYYVSGQEWMGEAFFEQVLSSERLGKEERALACYGQALCLLRRDEVVRALACLKPFGDELRQTDVAPYVRLLREVQP